MPVLINGVEQVAPNDATYLVQAAHAGLTAELAIGADPNADRIIFWDDSAAAFAYLTAGTGLTITDTTIATSGSSAVTREGGNLTEATTSSTSPVDLLTASSLNIAQANPFSLVCSDRKTNVHASYANIGLKLNATSVIGNTQFTNNSVATESGVFNVWSGARVTNYLEALDSRVGSSGRTYYSATVPVAAPAAAITDLICTAVLDNGTNTMGLDDLNAYKWANA